MIILLLGRLIENSDFCFWCCRQVLQVVVPPLVLRGLVPNYPVITAITAVIIAILVFRVRKRLSCGNEEKQARSRITCEARAVTNRVPASRASFASSCFSARSHARKITAVTGKLPENCRISPNRESNSVTRYRVIRNQGM